MGRPKGSKNGVRKVPLKVPKKSRVKKHQAPENDLPKIDEHIMHMFNREWYPACIQTIDHYMEENIKTGENMNHYKALQASAYIKLGDSYDDAHQVLDELIASDPSYSSGFFGKGVAFFHQKKYEESLKMFDTALELNPGFETERVTHYKMLVDCKQRRAVVVIKRMKDASEDIIMPEDFNAFVEDFRDIESAVMEEINSSKTEADLVTTIFDSTIEIDKSTEISIDKDSLPALADYSCGNVLDADFPEATRLPEPKTPPPPFIPEGLPQGFIPITAQDFFAKASELYSVGLLKAAQTNFEKAFELDPSFTETKIMAEKADELADLVDLAHFNLNAGNFRIVSKIASSGLEIDPTNDSINQLLYYYRGWSFYRLGKMDRFNQDFAEYKRLTEILN